MAAAGPDWRTNYRTQIRWGEGYIHDVYGTPSNAYALWLSRSPHWYDDGGWWPSGTWGINTSGSAEYVLTHQDMKHGLGGTQYHAHFDGLTGQAIEGHVRFAFRAMEMQRGTLQRSGRKA